MLFFEEQTKKDSTKSITETIFFILTEYTQNQCASQEVIMRFLKKSEISDYNDTKEITERTRK